MCEKGSLEEQAKMNDEQSKQRMKLNMDSKFRSKDSQFVVGERVLLSNNTGIFSKTRSKFCPFVYTIVAIKGSMITARSEGHVITRNASFFHKFIEENVDDFDFKNTVIEKPSSSLIINSSVNSIPTNQAILCENSSTPLLDGLIDANASEDDLSLFDNSEKEKLVVVDVVQDDVLEELLDHTLSEFSAKKQIGIEEPVSLELESDEDSLIESGPLFEVDDNVSTMVAASVSFNDVNEVEMSENFSMRNRTAPIRYDGFKEDLRAKAMKFNAAKRN